MASEPQILYLEPDDEITSVIRRLRQTDASRVVLVAPARTKATSSAVALRLLAGVAAELGRELSLVADPLARTFAADAGIDAFATVAEATSGAAPVALPAAARAPIHVVRPDEPTEARPSRQPVAAAAVSRTDDTVAVPLARPPRVRVDTPARRPASRGRGATAGRGIRLAGVAILIVALLLAGTAGAAVLPAAEVHISPASRPVGPVAYELVIHDVEQDAGEIPLTKSGTATGDHVESAPATGQVTFENWNYRRVDVPKGMQVAAGDVVFVTTDGVRVSAGKLTGRGTIQSGTARVGVVAAKPGTAGNVAANAINRVVDPNMAAELRGFPSNLPLVHNDEPTSGGVEDHQPEITQADVDGVKQQIAAELAAQLAKHWQEAATERVVGPAAVAEEPVVEVPKGLVGTVGQASFELTGKVAYQRATATRDAVGEAARQKLLADSSRTPSGTEIDPDSISVTLGEATAGEGGLSVAVRVSGSAAPSIDLDAIRQLIAGKTADEAQALLTDIGPASVKLWPGWVSRVPTLDWRISIATDAPPASHVPSPSVSN
jgi:archaellum component FlaG (FlaF/FlaG flagellin family)